MPRAVDLRRFHQGLRRLTMEIVKDQHTQNALEALPQNGGDHKGLHRAVRQLQPGEGEVIGQGCHLRGQQEGQDQHGHPEVLQREFVPGEAVAHHGADEHLADGRQQGQHQVLPQAVPVVQGQDGILVVFPGDLGGQPLGGGVQKIAAGHKGAGEHVQHRIEVNERDGDKQHIHDDGHKQSALIRASQHPLLEFFLPDSFCPVLQFHVRKTHAAFPLSSSFCTFLLCMPRFVLSTSRRQMSLLFFSFFSLMIRNVISSRTATMTVYIQVMAAA